MSEKLIVEARNLPMAVALEYAREVVAMGRISGEMSARGPQYLYHSVFKDGVRVSAFKNRKSDRLVVYRPEASGE